jgi:hypothetical protein
MNIISQIRKKWVGHVMRRNIDSRSVLNGEIDRKTNKEDRGTVFGASQEGCGEEETWGSEGAPMGCERMEGCSVPIIVM